MRITCFITVCVCLSSVVSANEIQFLNRIKRTRLREDLTQRDFALRKKISPIPEIYPDVYSTLQRSRAKVRIESFQKPRKIRGVLFGPQQHHYYNRGHSRRLLKRLKTRSISGAPYEVDDNQLNELTKPNVHDEKPIHIEPILRVTTKKNVFDSIVDILQQLLNPPKNEPGPLVGPINVPGSARKIYLRLMEPVESSHMMVRFVTQIPVPVVDAEAKHPIIPFPPIIDPAAVILQNQHTVLSDAAFASTRHLPRNASRTSDKTRDPKLSKPSVLNPSSPSKDVQDDGTSGKDDFLPGKEEKNKNPFAELNIENLNQMKQLLNDSTTAIENSDLKTAEPETWYGLSTHRLPLRQIAPLYPPLSVEHPKSSSSSSYEDTYKVPSDVLIGTPSSYSSPYAQFNNVDSAPGPYTNSYDYGAPSSYSASYNKPNDVHTTPSSYSTSYQKQNEFNDGRIFYPTPHWNQDEFKNGPSTFPPSDKEPYDLDGASSLYSASYIKPINTSSSSSSSVSSSYEKQNGDQITLNSNDALRVVDPPPFFPAYQRSSESYANRSSSIEHSTIRQPHYNLQDSNEVGTNSRQRNDHQVIWGEMKREKNEPSVLRQNEGSSEANDDHDSWQPVVYERENTDWYKAYADLKKVANDRHEIKQSVEHSRKTSRNTKVKSLERASAVDRHQSVASRRRGTPIPATRAPKCPVSGKEDECEQAKPALISNLETSKKIVEKQTQPTVEPVVVVVSKTDRSDTVENKRLLYVSTKSPATSSTTSRSLTERPLIVTTKSPTVSSKTEIPLLLMRTTKSSVLSSATERFIVNLSEPMADNVKLTMKPTMKSTVKPTVKSTMKPTVKSTVKATLKAMSSTTEKPSAIENTTIKEALSDPAKKLLPKRPMVMKKSAVIMNKIELSSTTMRMAVSNTTPRPTMSSTTKKMMAMKNRGGGISRTKSSTI